MLFFFSDVPKVRNDIMLVCKFFFIFCFLNPISSAHTERERDTVG